MWSLVRCTILHPHLYHQRNKKCLLLVIFSWYCLEMTLPLFELWPYLFIDRLSVSYVLGNGTLTCGWEQTGKWLVSASCWIFEHWREQKCTRSRLLSLCHAYWHLSWETWRSPACRGGGFPVPRDQLCYLIDFLSSMNRKVIVTAALSFQNLFFNSCIFFPPLQRARVQHLVRSLSLIMVDASLGTIQCLEEIVSTCLAWV